MIFPSFLKDVFVVYRIPGRWHLKTLVPFPSCLHGQMEKIHLMINLLLFYYFYPVHTGFLLGGDGNKEKLAQKKGGSGKNKMEDEGNQF